MLGLLGFLGFFSSAIVVSGKFRSSDSEDEAEQLAQLAALQAMTAVDDDEPDAADEPDTRTVVFEEVKEPAGGSPRDQDLSVRESSGTSSQPVEPPAQTPPPPPADAPATGDTGSAPVTEAPDIVTSGGKVDISGGRVSTLEIAAPKDVSFIEIIAGPEHGNATINPDDSVAVVMSGSDFSGVQELTYKLNFTDGSSETQSLDLDVSKPLQEAGWGLGKHYMLEEDSDGDVIVETGENHRKIYISESDDALSRADIAALEGIDASKITGKWLAEQEDYGGSESEPLTTDLAMDLWREVSPIGAEPSSHWLLFEKGYSYDGVDRLIQKGVSGEDPLHPIHITSFGEGDRPIIESHQRIFQGESENIVFSDVHFTGGIQSLTGSNILFHDVKFTENAMNIQNGEAITLHDSEVAYVVADKPDGDTWSGTIAGLFSHKTESWLIEGTIFHHNGWEDDYRADWSTEGGMPPNMRSHNVYLQNDTTDVTFRDNILSQGASFGAHIRGGGYVEDNVFVDNNNAVDVTGGVYDGEGPIGNYTFFSDNVITSAGHKTTDRFDGGVTRGVTNKGVDTVFLDNIVAHLANPDDPGELAEKNITHSAFINDGSFAYDDTIVYNWIGSDPKIVQDGYQDRNTDGLDTDAADATTYQRFAAAVLGDPDATIDDLADAIIAYGDTEFDDQITADDIIAYFQSGFGITLNADDSATEHRFIPNDLADGVRWDNRINWDTEDVPDDGDSVDLGGNWVQYGGTVTVEDLNLGSGGKLSVNHGKLSVDGTLEVGENGGEISTDRAGQFWTEGYTDADSLVLDVNGGRFANTGDMTGQTSLHVDGKGQAVLAADSASYVVNDGAELRIEGSEAKVGFDGGENGVGILQMADDATLTFVADEDGFSAIEEFRSGHWDQEGSDVRSGASLDGTLRIDLTNYAGGAGTHVLMSADAVDGAFDAIEIYGQASNLDSLVVIDYENDTLSLELVKGGGNVGFSSLGEAGDSNGENAALWAALTAGQGSFDDTPPLISEDDNEVGDLMVA